MFTIGTIARCLLVTALCGAGGIAPSSVARAQKAASAPTAKPPVPALLQQMVGTWDVRQRMWPGFGTEPVNLPPAVARRRVVEGAFLEEVMEATQQSGSDAFTRTSVLSYNSVNQQYEYFSMDSRAPQMMFEKSMEAGSATELSKEGLKLYGGTFVAAQWGEAKNATFMYRLAVGAIETDRQVVQLYFTPQSGPGSREFLAFEYVYTRQR